MVIEIAGIEIALTIDGADFTARLAERYAGFLVQDAAHPFHIELTIDPHRRPDRYHPTHVDNPCFACEGDLTRAAVSGDGFDAEFSWDTGRAAGTLPDSLAHLDLALRIALAGILLRTDGTLLHAAGIVRDHFGLICSGPSGAGKSTIASLAAGTGQTVLADELVIVRRRGAGTRVFGTPFWNGTPTSAPVGALLLLEHAPTHRAERLPPERALPRLLQAGGAPLPLPPFQEAYFAACAELLRRTVAYRFGFAPRPDFWTGLDRLPEFSFFRPKLRRLAARGGGTGSTPKPLGVLERR